MTNQATVSALMDKMVNNLTHYLHMFTDKELPKHETATNPRLKELISKAQSGHKSPLQTDANITEEALLPTWRVMPEAEVKWDKPIFNIFKVVLLSHGRVGKRSLIKAIMVQSTYYSKAN